MRPIPVMISSKIKRMLCRSQISRRIGRYSSGGSITPPVWPIGSTMMAATVAGSSISTTSLDDRRAGDAAIGVGLAERAAVAGRRKDVQEARRQRLVDRLARLQSRGRQRTQRRAVPRLVAADDLVLAGRAGQLVILPGQLDGRLGRPPSRRIWNFTVERSPGASSASRLASCTASGLVPCIGGENASDVELLP